jgi:hypothetical protein
MCTHSSTSYMRPCLPSITHSDCLNTVLPTVRAPSGADGGGLTTFTGFSGVTSAWYTLRELDGKDLGAAACHLSVDRTVFTMPGANTQEVTVHLQQFRQFAKSTSAQLEEDTAALLPPNILHNEMLDALKVARDQDKFGSGKDNLWMLEALVKQDKHGLDPQEIALRTIASKLILGYTGDGEQGLYTGVASERRLDVSKLKVFHAKYEQALIALALDLFLCSGIPPRSSAMAQWLFTGRDRAVRICVPHVLVGYNGSKAEALRTVHQDDIRGLKESSGLALMLLLLIRQVVIGLVKQVLIRHPQDPLAIHLDDYQNYVFCSLYKGRWVPQKFSTLLRNFGIREVGSPFRDLYLRSYATGVLSYVTHGCGTSTLYSSIAKQGDHTEVVAAARYGLVSEDRTSDPREMVELSGIWRAIMQTEPVQDNWDLQIRQHPLLGYDVRYLAAEQCSRFIVHAHLKGCIRDAVEVAERARASLVNMEFIMVGRSSWAAIPLLSTQHESKATLHLSDPDLTLVMRTLNEGSLEMHDMALLSNQLVTAVLLVSGTVGCWG